MFPPRQLLELRSALQMACERVLEAADQRFLAFTNNGNITFLRALQPILYQLKPEATEAKPLWGLIESNDPWPDIQMLVLDGEALGCRWQFELHSLYHAHKMYPLISERGVDPDSLQWRVEMPSHQLDKMKLDRRAERPDKSTRQLVGTVVSDAIKSLFQCDPLDAKRIVEFLKKRSFQGLRLLVRLNTSGTDSQSQINRQLTSIRHLKDLFPEVDIAIALKHPKIETESLIATWRHQSNVKLWRVTAPEKDQLRKSFLDLVKLKAEQEAENGYRNINEDQRQSWIDGQIAGWSVELNPDSASISSEALYIGQAIMFPTVQRKLFFENHWACSDSDRAVTSISTIKRLVSTALSEEAAEGLSCRSRQFNHEQQQRRFEEALWESFFKNSSSFVTVLGRGLNSLCGIPNNIQLTEYLLYVAERALNSNAAQQIWRAEQNHWPSNPTREELKTALGDLRERLNLPVSWEKDRQAVILTTARQLIIEEEISDGPKRDAYIFSSSVARKWPSLLLALCRLEHGGINRELLSNFNVRMMSGAMPCSVHTSLVNLIRPLRMRCLIDMVGGGVLETSLHKCGRPFHVRSTGDPAQPPRAEGSPTELTVVRWPVSVDRVAAMPTNEIAIETASDAEVDALWSWIKTNPKEPSKCLLLLGVTNTHWWPSLLRDILPRLSPKQHVFLVTDSMTARNKLYADTELAQWINEEKLFLRVASRPDLLLYELYVGTTQSLPPATHPYQFQHAVPPHPMPVAFDQVGQFEADVEHVLKVVSDEEAKTDWEINSDNVGSRSGRLYPDPEDPNLRRILWLHGRAGISGMASRTFWRLSQIYGSRCLWFGLNEFSCCDHIERAIVHRLADLVGAQRWASLALSSANPLERFLDLVSSNQLVPWPITFRQNEWVVFVEARGIPGIDAGIAARQPWPQKDIEKLETKVFCALAKHHVTVVYLPMSQNLKSALIDLVGERAYGDSKPQLALSQIKEFKELLSGIPTSCLLPIKLKAEFSAGIFTLRTGLADSVEHLSPKAMNWWHGASTASEKWQRACFLYALTLFRETRHYSAITSEVIHAPLDWGGRLFDTTSQPPSKTLPPNLHDYATKTARDYLTELEENGIVRHHRGAFIHMPWFLREELRAQLEEICPKCPETGRALTSRRSVMHFRIGQWYWDAYLSSQDPPALVKCLHHLVESIRSVGTAEPPGVSSNKATKNYRNGMKLVAIQQLRKGLRIATKVVRTFPEMAYAFERLGPEGRPLKLGSLLRKDYSRVGKYSKLVLDDVRSLHRIVQKQTGNAYADRLNHKTRKELEGQKDSRPSVTGMPAASKRLYESERKDLLVALALFVDPSNNAKNPPLVPTLASMQQAFLAECGDDNPQPLSAWLDRLEGTVRTCSNLARNSLLMAKRSSWLNADGQLRESIFQDRGYQIADKSSLAFVHLMEAIQFSTMTHRFGWSLPPEKAEFQFRTSFNAHSITASALARLGRFAEAHRLLNTASSYLNANRVRTASAERGRLMLRRAEVFLLQSSIEDDESNSISAHLLDALYWVRLGSSHVLAHSRYSPWLSHALLLEAEILHRCLNKHLTCFGIMSELARRWVGLVQLANQLFGTDPFPLSRILAMVHATTLKGLSPKWYTDNASKEEKEFIQRIYDDAIQGTDVKTRLLMLRSPKRV